MYITILQQINSYNIYSMISVQNYYKILYSSLVYQFVIIVIILFFMGHVLGSGIVTDFKLALDLGASFPWFFIVITFLTINHKYISLFLNATLGGCLLKHAGHPWDIFLLSWFCGAW